MAKNFPYFKFISARWLLGNIAFEDLSVQGLFVNICALYWERDGLVMIEDINNRYRNPPELAKLTDRYFSVKDGFISIKFLDEQLHEANHVSKTNSKNGSLGGRPKTLVTIEKKPTALVPLSENEAKKSKEEVNKNKSKEEENKRKENKSSENEFSAAKEFKPIFEKFYFEKTKENYYWTGKDAAKCKPLFNKLSFKIKEKISAKKEIENSEVITGFEYLLSIIKDEWILSNLSISIIDSKFNEIIAQKNGIKKGNNSDRQSRVESVSALKNDAIAILEHYAAKNGNTGV